MGSGAKAKGVRAELVDSSSANHDCSGVGGPLESTAPAPLEVAPLEVASLEVEGSSLVGVEVG